MARIVIAEFMDERAVQRLADRHEVLYAPDLVDRPADLAREAGQCEALVVRNRTQVRGALLDALGRSGRGRVVGRLGVGLDNIDVAGCESAGLQVIPATGANALSVAEYVITAAMLLLRGHAFASAQVAAGQWPRAALSGGRETAGKVMGIVGFGSIGQTVGRLAAALGMEVVAYDPAVPAGADLFARTGVRPLGLDALVHEADVVTLHIPLLDSTRGLFHGERLATMKRGAVLINTSRGHIVDLKAVAAALHAGRLGGAAIDVFDVEPLPAAAELQNCPNLLLTPHISGVSVESNERVSFMIADRLLEALG